MYNSTRRRLMMGQNKGKDYVLFMPLSYGDTSDHISGSNSWYNAHFNWDNNENAYYFDQNSQQANKLVGVSIPWNQTIDINCIIEFDAKLINSGNFSMMGWGCNSGSSYCDHSLYYQHQITGTNGYLPLNQWCHVKAIRTPGGNIEHYTDGVLVGTLTQNNANSGTGTVYFSPTGARWSSNSGVRVFIKNIEIYKP